MRQLTLFPEIENEPVADSLPVESEAKFELNRTCPRALFWQSIFKYREDGVLIWKHNRGNRFKAGTRAGCYSKDGRVYASIQLKINGKYRVKLVHRIIFEMFFGEICDKSLVVDHINRNKKDNRIENLRIATRSENSANSSRGADVGIYRRGDGFRKPWSAQIKKNGKLYTKAFETKLGAFRWRSTMARELHGDFANIEG